MISQAESGGSILERTKDLLATAGDTFSHAIDRMVTTTQSAAGSVADTIAPITSTQATLFQTWLESHPNMERSLQVFNWTVNHPIISVIILLFLMAIAWILIKSIGRLFENFLLSILRIPLKLGYFLIQASWRSLGNLLPRLSHRFAASQPQSLLPPKIDKSDNRERRLLEIATQLIALNQEQERLMQEALAILDSTQIKPKDIPDIFQQKIFSNVD